MMPRIKINPRALVARSIGRGLAWRRAVMIMSRGGPNAPRNHSFIASPGSRAAISRSTASQRSFAQVPAWAAARHASSSSFIAVVAARSRK